jgi:hypothetical protein
MLDNTSGLEPLWGKLRGGRNYHQQNQVRSWDVDNSCRAPKDNAHPSSALVFFRGPRLCSGDLFTHTLTIVLRQRTVASVAFIPSKPRDLQFSPPHPCGRKLRPLLCHPERSRGICSSLDRQPTPIGSFSGGPFRGRTEFPLMPRDPS